MRLNSLQLVNFRNYNNLYLEFNKKVADSPADLKQRADEFLKFVRGIQKKAEKRGLTERKLNKILNDNS